MERKQVGRKQIKLIRMFQLITIIALVLLAIFFTVFDLSSSTAEFEQRSTTMRSEYLTQQKNLIKREVMRAASLIDEHRSHIMEETRDAVKHWANIAVAVAENIYQQNKDVRSDGEIKKMILDALRAIRYAHGAGYYFITRLDGHAVLFADKPDLEGTNLLNIHDTKEKPVVQDMIEIVQNEGEGFYEYTWTKPGSQGNDHKKISYVKSFKPFDWFIGTGLYVEDIESHTQKDLLSLLSKVSFGENGYLFVDKLNGEALLTKGKILSGKQKVWEIYSKNQQAIKAAFDEATVAALKPAGDFVYYSIGKKINSAQHFSKVSFIYGIPEWQWFIGAGVYLDEVEQHIAALQKELTRQQRTRIQKNILVMSLLILIVLTIFYLISQRIKKDMDMFSHSLDQAAQRGKAIDREQIYFAEISQVAEKVNSVLQDKKDAEQQTQLSEQKYKHLFDSALVGIFRSRVTDGPVY